MFKLLILSLSVLFCCSCSHPKALICHVNGDIQMCEKCYSQNKIKVRSYRKMDSDRIANYRLSKMRPPVLEIIAQTPKIIPRRTPSSNQKGTAYFLPLIHQNNEEVIDGWDGSEQLEEYLFYSGYLIAKDGDSIVPISNPNQLKIFFAKDSSKNK